MLGGVISSIALYLKMPLLLVVIAIIPVLEALSDIIQVMYYKKTGKSIQNGTIAPSFELSGWKKKIK